MKDLKKSYHAVSLAEPPRTTIPLEGRPSKGPADAPVTIVEFSDFECPYCRALFPTLQQITEEYKHKVRIVYLQFPLADMHPHALKAAEASLCAFEQDKFWQMHDAIFTDQTHLQVQDLKQKALELSLNMDLFIACLDSGKQFARVRSDVGEGVKAGVSGTPALFSMVEFSLEISPLARSDESSRMSCGAPASNRRETVASITILFVDC